MVSSAVRFLRFASLFICVIVIASFTIFALGQTKTASGHQQEQLNGLSATSAASATHPAASTTHESSLHKAIDEASNQLTSPFAGVVSASSGEWATRSVKLLLALIVYGFGLGYLARVIRVRTH